MPSGSNLTLISDEGFPATRRVPVSHMRTGIAITLGPSDRAVWQRSLGIATRRTNMSDARRLSVKPLTASAPMRSCGGLEIPKTCVWRWQERFMQAVYDSLRRDKKRPTRVFHHSDRIYSSVWSR